MMAGSNPSSSWWRIMNNTSSISQQQQQQQLQFPQLVLGGVESSFSDNHQDLPQSWSQLLLGGLAGEEDKFGGVVGHFQPFKKLENWEDQILNPITPIRASELSVGGSDHVKQEQEVSQNRNDQELNHHHHQQHHSTSWSQTTMPVSSPKSCVTTSFSSTNNNNNTILDFSNNNNKATDGPPRRNQHPPPDHSSECNSTATGGACKKARVQPSSSQPPLKVRKEKLGDRITALHRLVSPFGKTDTASVLLEAIGYIRFLQGQIEALSSPYLGNASGNMRTQHSVIQGERNSVFVGEAGNGMQIDSQEKVKDLRSRGLCLVPVSCTQQVGSSDNGADYWAPAFGSGGGF